MLAAVVVVTVVYIAGVLAVVDSALMVAIVMLVTVIAIEVLWNWCGRHCIFSVRSNRSSVNSSSSSSSSSYVSTCII